LGVETTKKAPILMIGILVKVPTIKLARNSRNHLKENGIMIVKEKEKILEEEETAEIEEIEVAKETEVVEMIGIGEIDSMVENLGTTEKVIDKVKMRMIIIKVGRARTHFKIEAKS
jgi:hypothetical protein